MSGSKLSEEKHTRPAVERDSPLGLTVHSLPRPEQLGADPAQRTRVGRLKMLLVLAICAAPVLASYLTYYVIRPDIRHSFGELIEPQRDLPSAVGLTLDGQEVALPSLKGQWLLVSVAGGACDADCQQRLYEQRQLRESLGKDKDRLDWVWLISDEAPVPPALLPALGQATVLRVKPAVLASWLAPASGRQLQEHLYLVDPLGHWMMRFPPQLDMSGAAKVKRDLERLMRASASWDEPGR